MLYIKVNLWHKKEGAPVEDITYSIKNTLYNYILYLIYINPYAPDSAFKNH